MPTDSEARPAGAASSQPPQLQPPQQVTVETETVPTVPTLGVAASSVNPNGTLRIKRSQDSVPRVTTRAASKKRSQRLAQGSKADIFAAKVANAVDEHDSSGSDETFVYDTPQPHVHANDSMRKPFLRTLSSTNPNEDGTYTDYNYESESDDNMPGSAGPANGASASENMSSTANSGSASANPASPKKTVENAPRSPRSFVVPNRNRRTVSSSLIPPNTAETSDYNTYLAQSALPNNPSRLHHPPLPSPSSETENTLSYDDYRNWPSRARHSRKNSRSKPSLPAASSGAPASAAALTANSDGMSPTRDPNDSIRAKHSYLQRWRTPASGMPQLSDGGTNTESDERTNLLKARPSLYNYHSSKNSYGRRAAGMGRLNQGNIPFDEYSQQPSSANLRGSSDVYSGEEPYPKLNDNPSLATRFLLVVSLVLIMLLSLVFVVGALLAAARPLQDFDVVSLSDVFVSDRELVFSLITRARNSGLLSITVGDCELDVFATSLYTKSRKHEHSPRTVLLGSINEFESPMRFHGGLSSATQWHSAAAKLVEPLANNTELWSYISANEFDLTIKGVVSYDILGSEHRETVSRAYHVKAPEFDDDYHMYERQVVDTEVPEFDGNYLSYELPVVYGDEASEFGDDRISARQISVTEAPESDDYEYTSELQIIDKDIPEFDTHHSRGLQIIDEEAFELDDSDPISEFDDTEEVIELE